MKLFILLFLFSSNISYAKLLDKVAGVINDKTFTLSEIKRVQETVSIRKEIAPFIYQKSDLSQNEVFNLLKEKFIIKDKLSELGYVINDDSVEDRISQTEKSLGLNRNELHRFLKSKNITFNEYFELIREAMEYNIFNSKIIAPLVTITDQELKNLYYNQNQNNKALSFKYKAVDFTLPEKAVRKADFKKLPEILSTYQKSGNIPKIYSEISANDLGNIADDDLPRDLQAILKSTNEKGFSKPYIKDGLVHIFYIDSKDLVESADYLKNKGQIYNSVFAKRAEDILQNWFSRESLNYYILNNL